MNIKSHVNGLRFSGNIYVALIYHLGLVMALFTICRLGFYVFNLSLFPDITFSYFAYILLGGLRFDLTAVIYTNALLILLMIVPFQFRFNQVYLKICSVVFYVSNSLALMANVADFVYYPFTGRRTTADVFQQFKNEGNMGGLFLKFLVDYWYALLFWIVLIALLVWLHKKIKVTGPQLVNKVAFYGWGVLAVPLIAFLSVGGVRGDWLHSTRPITLSDAGKYVRNPQHVSLVLNTPFAIYRTLNKTKIKKVNYYSSQEELSAQFDPTVKPVAGDSLKKINVVLIVLESFSREFMGFYNGQREQGNYKGYTPFLDSLFANSRTFKWSIANGRKSIDALPSLTASIPAMGIPYILSPFSGNRINSLGTLLKSEGYTTSFFHGAPNGSMGFEAFMNVAGIDHYYGMTEYGNDKDYDGWWGIWDEKFMGYMADTQKDFQEPFFSTFFSVTSHHPFSIPKEYESRFQGGSQPILRCIQYTDNALRQYFKKVSKYPWFKNTIFVISADHCSSNILFEDGKTSVGRYTIPIAFYRPDNSLAGLDSTVIQQIDVMPTVLSYLGYAKPYISFGRNVLNPNKQKGIAWNVIEDTYNLYTDRYLLQFNGQKSVGLFAYNTDVALSKNLLNQLPDTVKAMEPKLKAIIQQYNNRMVNNDLTFKP